MCGSLCLHFANLGFSCQLVRICHSFPHGIGHIGANRSVQISRRCIGFNFPFGFADCRNNRILERDDLFDDLMAEQDRKQ